MRALVAALAFAACFAQADYRDGLEDLGRGRFDEAYAELKAAAESGDVNAARYLGWLCERGMQYHGAFFAPRPAESAMWYRKAAAAGDKHSGEMLGVLHTAGHGVPRDTAEALRWFRKTRDVDATIAALSRYPEAVRPDLAAWVLSLQVVMRREVDRGSRTANAGTVVLLFDAGADTVTIRKSDAAAPLENTALKWGRLALETVPPPPGAAAVGFRTTVPLDFRTPR